MQRGCLRAPGCIRRTKHTVTVPAGTIPFHALIRVRYREIMSVVSDIMSCKICSAPVDNWAHAEVLHKYQVSYFMCSVCGFVNTERPYWLNEAYSEPIAPRSEERRVGKECRSRWSP